MSPYGRVLLAGLTATALLFTAAAPADATSLSGLDTRTIASHSVFDSTSFFYQKLPTSTPAASDSAALVASLNQQAHEYYGTPTEANVSINTQRYAPALYVARNTDPSYNVVGWNCQNKAAGWNTAFNKMMLNVRIPNDMQPDPSSDGAVSIYNPDAKDVVELWQARKVDGQWQACWGGRITNAGDSLGIHQSGYGASASGLALWGGTIKQQELLNGHIDHVVSLAIPRVKKGTISWPANRTDGWTDGTQLAIGQMLRLPASVNLDAMKLSPAARTVAKAAQEYGIMITDTSGSVAFSAENPVALASNQYSTIFRNRWPFLEMLGNKSLGEVPFPLDKLVALPLNYQAPTATSGTTTSPTSTSSTYAKAVQAAGPAAFWRLDDAGSTAADASGHQQEGTLRGVSRFAAGALSDNTAIRTYGDASSGVYQKVASTPAKAFTVQVWFKTTTNAGGKILGFENTQTGKGSRYDRSLYLTNDGRLVFGTYSSVVKKVVTNTSYNDGQWHQAAATQGSDGTRLYVDGALVGSNDATSAQAGSGYWRLGGGNLDGWPYKPTSPYIAASLDEFAYFGSALSAGTIAAVYKARA